MSLIVHTRTIRFHMEQLSVRTLVSFSSPQDAAIVTLLLDSACDVAAVDLQVLFSSLAPCLDFCVLTEIEMLFRALCLIFFYYRGKLL